MQPIKIKTPIGPVLLSHVYGGRNYKIEGSTNREDRTISFEINLRVDKKGTVDRENIACHSTRNVGGVLVKSSVGGKVSDEIMQIVCPSASNVIKKNRFKWYFEVHIKSMMENADSYRKYAADYMKRAKKQDWIVARAIKTGRLPKREAWR